MSQLYAQTASRPDPWLLGRTSAGLCTLQTACPLTVTYSGGTPAVDTIAAGSAATVYGGSAAAFDASTDVWVALTVPGSGALQVTKEAELATVTGDWAGLARIVQHSTEPYQPSAYLAAGGLGTGGVPTTVTPAASAAGQGKVITESAGATDPAGWQALGFNDSAWAAPVQEPAGILGSPVAGTQWVAKVAGATHPAGEITLLRHTFTLPVGVPSGGTLQVQADEETTGLWVNGVFLGTGSTWFAGIQTIAVPGSALVGGGANVLAIKLDAGLGGLADYEAVTYALSVTYVPPGGVPAPSSSAEGDLLYYHAGVWTDLSIGTSGQRLASDGTDPYWATGGSGTVTSIDVAVPAPLSSSGGPITASGTITLSWASGQTANRVLASPSGSSGAVSLRALVAGDIPSLPASQITSGALATARGGTGLDGSGAANGALLIGNGAGYTLATITAGSGIGVTNSAGGISIAATGGGGSGTVTSIALTVPSFLAVSGSPISTSGTLGVTLATQTQGAVFAGPASGSAAAPTFRALQGSDLPAAAGAGGHVHAHGHFL